MSFLWPGGWLHVEKMYCVFGLGNACGRVENIVLPVLPSAHSFKTLEGSLASYFSLLYLAFFGDKCMQISSHRFSEGCRLPISGCDHPCRPDLFGSMLPARSQLSRKENGLCCHLSR